MKPPDEEILRKLQGMNEYEFEELIADLWEKQGWDTTVTSGSNDRGVDVIAKKDIPVNQKQAIQAKKYSSNNKISGPDIQQYSSLKHQIDDVDTVIVVTTSCFTEQAQETATDLGVETIEGSELMSIINKFGKPVLNKYLNLDGEKNNNIDFEYNNENVIRIIKEHIHTSKDITTNVIVDGIDVGYAIDFGMENDPMVLHLFGQGDSSAVKYNNKQIDKIHSIADSRNLELYFKDNNEIIVGRETKSAQEGIKTANIVDDFLQNVVFIW